MISYLKKVWFDKIILWKKIFSWFFIKDIIFIGLVNIENILYINFFIIMRWYFLLKYDKLYIE